MDVHHSNFARGLGLVEIVDALQGGRGGQRRPAGSGACFATRWRGGALQARLVCRMPCCPAAAAAAAAAQRCREPPAAPGWRRGIDRIQRQQPALAARGQPVAAGREGAAIDVPGRLEAAQPLRRGLWVRIQAVCRQALRPSTSAKPAGADRKAPRTWLPAPRLVTPLAGGSSHTATPLLSKMAARRPPCGPGSSDTDRESADWKWCALQRREGRGHSAVGGVAACRRASRRCRPGPRAAPAALTLWGCGRRRTRGTRAPPQCPPPAAAPRPPRRAAHQKMNCRLRRRPAPTRRPRLCSSPPRPRLPSPRRCRPLRGRWGRRRHEPKRAAA